MKRKLLLALIPALMVLSSCAGVNQKALNENNLFVEDTVAHEEIFGQAESGSKRIAPFKALTPVDSSAPAIAVQKRNEAAGEISIRFVAAVKIVGDLDKTTAVWTRTMYKANGSVKSGKEADEFPSTKAYTSILDGGSELTIDAFNDGKTDYTHFVVYTMRHIPITGEGDANASNYHLNVYLTLDNTENDAYDAQSKVVSTTGDGTSQFAYRLASRSGKNGFFLSGTIKGSAGEVIEDSSTRGDNAATFTADFQANDSFVVVQDTGSFFKIWDGSCLRSAGNGFSAVDNKVKVGTATRYVVYLNGSNEIWHTQYRLTGTDFYLRGTVSPDGWDPGESSAYRLVTDPDNLGVLLNVHLDNGDFKIAKADWSYAQGADRVIGGAAGNFSTGASDNNIHCDKAGYYDIYLTNNYYVSIELVSLDPVV